MWFYAKDGNREGPVALEELRKLLETHHLPLTTVVWTRGMDQWRPANEVPAVIAGISGNYVTQPAAGTVDAVLSESIACSSNSQAFGPTSS